MIGLGPTELLIILAIIFAALPSIVAFGFIVHHLRRNWSPLLGFIVCLLIVVLCVVALA